MKKTALAIIAVALVGMAPPAPRTGSGALPAEAAGGYPPCSKTVTDRCIQLYERGVSTPRNLALNRELGARTSAMGGPYEAPTARASSSGFGWSSPAAKSGYPPCSKAVTDRCIQLYERGVSGAGN